MRKNLTLSKADLENIQIEKLKALVTHAYENVPYYRKLLDKNRIKPGDIKGIKDIEKIPVTDKAVLRCMRRDDIMAKNIEIRNCVKVFTSGSTGMPTHIYFTQKDYEFLDIVYLRSFLENGLNFKHKRAFIVDPHSFDAKKRWYNLLGLARSTNISCFMDPMEQIEVLRNKRPDFIHGYPSSLSQIAKIIIEGGFSGIQPSIISTAAELLYKKDRKIIAEAFKVDPYDRYAARECGNISWECGEHKGYHINMDALVVEVINEGKPARKGEKGEVVITNLHSYAMPFIRYRIGDVGALIDIACPCGIELPMMEVIEGRDEDFMTLKNGEKISPMMVTGVLDYVPGIKQFRVVQEEINSVLVVIAKGNSFDAKTIARVERDLKALFGEGMNIRCHVENHIPRDPSGKVRAVVSRLS